jgi:hypothetical protein
MEAFPAAVIAGLVLAISIIPVLRLKNRCRRDISASKCVFNAPCPATAAHV